MASFPWLPVGHALPDGTAIGRVLASGEHHQIIRARRGESIVLLVESDSSAGHRLSALAEHRVMRANFLDRCMTAFVSSAEDAPSLVGDIPRRPEALSAIEAKDLATALLALAREFPKAAWSDALFVPDLATCLPFREDAEEDRRRLAFRLVTGGVEDESLSLSSIRKLNPWLTQNEIAEFLAVFGVEQNVEPTKTYATSGGGPFHLAGRPELEEFFQEYVIEHYRHEDRYAALGVRPPGGILIAGPPGSGKTFAVRRLADHLGWPVFELDLKTVGSPFIHETGVRLEKLFDIAAQKAPAIVVIDEIDALAGVRGMTSHDHKIEEISAFLRRIERAADNRVLVVGTTNRKDAIDPAFLRKGRFDHVLEVGYPGPEEVAALLEDLVAERPHSEGMNLGAAATRLAGRPMSDVAWAINEAARLAVKSGKDKVDDISLFGAIAKLR
jgi:hypothetical protein